MRAAKIARIQKLQGVGISNSRLLRLLAEVRRDPQVVQDITSRRQLDNSFAAIYDSVAEPVVLQLDDGTALDWEIVCMPRCIRHFADISDEFRAMLAELHTKRPSTPDNPWHWIIYFDEATPGAVLRQDNKRKVWCFYAGVKELGPDWLQHEAAWIPMAVLRTEVVKSVVGGFSACAKILLRKLLLSPGNLRTEGVVIPGLDAGLPAFVFVTIDESGGNILSDESALKYFWSSRGAQSLKPCFDCWNITSLDDDEDNLLAHDTTGVLRDITCADPGEFKLCTSADRFLQADVLSNVAPTMAARDFTQLQQSFGLNYNPHGVLWDRDLRELVRPAEVNRYDPTHCFFSNGICAKELGFCLERLQRAGVGFEPIRILLGADWKTPSHNRATGRLKDSFDTAREKHFKRTKDFSPGASETMDIMPAMRYFLEKSALLLPELDAEIKSFAALAHVVHLVKRGKCCELVGVSLGLALQDHAAKFARAYADEDKAYIPKFHFARHIPHPSDAWIMDTFTCERKHSMVKEAADPVRNTRSFEKSLLSRALVLQASRFHTLRADGLIDAAPCDELEEGALIAVCIRWHGTKIAEGDVLFLVETSEMFWVHGFAQIHGQLALLANACARVEQAA